MCGNLSAILRNTILNFIIYFFSPFRPPIRRCWSLLIFIRYWNRFFINKLFFINNTSLQGFVVGQLGVTSEVIFCVESESEVRIGPSRQDFEIFEVIYSKNGFLGYF